MFLAVSVLTTPISNDGPRHGNVITTEHSYEASSNNAMNRTKTSTDGTENDFLQMNENQRFQPRNNGNESSLYSDRGMHITLRQVMTSCALVCSDEDDDLKDSIELPSQFRILGNCIVRAMNSEIFFEGYHDILSQRRFVADSSGESNFSKIFPDDIKNAIVAIAMWLRSHLVITELQDYIVPMSNSGILPSNNVPVYKKEGEYLSTHKASNMASSTMMPILFGAEFAYEARSLYKELLSMSECSVGGITIEEFAWKMGLTPVKMKLFMEWGVKEKKIQIITRAPTFESNGGPL
mmetsp:Transcript_5118/g.7408  ORF Transcript_5118/g.7408 Transcript_5118/m.7408 type:complete len:294 (+) Transcript_5118:1363-2244(+)